MVIGGADPGRHGAVVAVSCTSEQGYYYKLAYDKAGHLQVGALYAFLDACGGLGALVLEKPQGRQGLGATQTFNFGFACGELNAALRHYASTKHIAVQAITPQAWQKVMHDGIASKLKGKDKTALAYKQLFPHLPVPCGPKGGAADDNVIDALLLAAFGVLRFGQGGLRRWQLRRAT